MAFRFIPAWCAAGSMVLAQEAKEAAATRRKEQTDRCSFTAKRIKDKIKKIYDTIVPVKFSWGAGRGFVKVSFD